jgi:hypothetical protein
VLVTDSSYVVQSFFSRFFRVLIQRPSFCLRVLRRSMLAEAAVHIVDGGVARRPVRGTVFQSGSVPVHTV